MKKEAVQGSVNLTKDHHRKSTETLTKAPFQIAVYTDIQSEHQHNLTFNIKMIDTLCLT